MELRQAGVPTAAMLTALALLAGCGSGGTSSTEAAGATATTSQNAAPAEQQQTVDLTALPLGDGKISTEPKRGNVYSCQTDFDNAPGGALADGPWIDSKAGTWDAKEKINVPGSNELDSSFEASAHGSVRTLTGNDIPSDPVGDFPVPSDSKAYSYDPNPNSISAQNFAIDVPKDPKRAKAPSCLSPGAIGVMLNGAYLFDALDGPGRDAVAHEIQDKCEGHPERTGAYHYHSLSPCIEGVHEHTHGPELVGYAIDGFGIYGHYGNDGQVLTDKDLDACHGLTSRVPWNGKIVRTYHYVATFEYPYTLGCFRGTPSTDAGLGAGSGAPAGGPP